MGNKTQAELLYKAELQQNIQGQKLENRKKLLGDLEDKERLQDRNLTGLKNYALKLRAETEEYRVKVELSEKIV
jgi:hypothetical protein